METAQIGHVQIGQARLWPPSATQRRFPRAGLCARSESPSRRRRPCSARVRISPDRAARGRGGVGGAAQLAHGLGGGFAKADAQFRPLRARDLLHGKLYAAVQVPARNPAGGRRLRRCFLSVQQASLCSEICPGLSCKSAALADDGAVLPLAFPENAPGRYVQPRALVPFRAPFPAQLFEKIAAVARVLPSVFHSFTP